MKLILLLSVVGFCFAADPQIREGVYRIENAADGLHVTTEGANTAFARVVGENWQNFREQRWRVEKSGTNIYNLMPEKHTTNNALSFYKDPAKKHDCLKDGIFFLLKKDCFKSKIKEQVNVLSVVDDDVKSSKANVTNIYQIDSGDFMAFKYLNIAHI